MQGKIKWWNINKGFGFIIDTETSEEFFFHRSYVISSRDSTIYFKPNDEVSFNTSKDKNDRTMAIDIELIKERESEEI
jgi:cold shock CspA family protein